VAANDKGRLLLRFTTRGAGQRDVGSFSRNQRVLHDTYNAGMNRLGQRAVRAIKLSGAVPEDTGQLLNSIHPLFFTRASRVQVTIRAEATDKGRTQKRGRVYDYVDVTRRGHKKAVIKPQVKRFQEYKRRGRTPWLGVRFEGHRNEGVKTRMPQVAGVKVGQDWVELVQDDIDREVERAQEEMGRHVASRILR
jgi:hypothetical protein